MPPGPIYIPPDQPGLEFPSADAAPEAVLYFRLYAGAMILLHVALALLGVFYLVTSTVPRSSGTPFAVDNLIVGVFYLGWGALVTAPFVIAVLGGRKRWVHTLATLTIAFSMMTVCCLPIAIPLLIQWQKPETRRWFDT